MVLDIADSSALTTLYERQELSTGCPHALDAAVPLQFRELRPDGCGTEPIPDPGM